MKVLILENAYFNETYYKKGATVDIKVDECPSWAKQLSTPKTNKTEEQKKEQELIALRKELYELTKKELIENATKEELIAEINKAKAQNGTNKTEEQKKEQLEELLNKAFDKGIYLEDTDKKSVDEQIAELEEILKG